MEKEKKKNKNKIKYETEESKEIKKFVIVLIVIIFAVALFYLATRMFITKDLFTGSNTKTEETTTGEINYDVAIMGEILNRPYKTYYVAIYNKTEGEYMSEMISLVYAYTAKDEHLHVYTVDLSNELNKSYYDPENIKLDVDNLKDLKVGDITLLKIKNGEIIKYYTDLEKMKKELDVE